MHNPNHDDWWPLAAVVEPPTPPTPAPICSDVTGAKRNRSTTPPDVPIEAIQLAWELGWAACEQAMADLLADRPAPLPAPARTREQAIAARRAELDKIAAARYARDGRSEYRGGPVTHW